MMKKLVNFGMSLFAMATMAVSCSPETNLSDEKKMKDFDFSNFENKELDIHLSNLNGDGVQTKAFLFDGVNLIAAGYSNKEGNWNPKINWDNGMNLSVYVPKGTKTDVGNPDLPVFATMKPDFIQQTYKTENSIDSDGDGVSDSLDVYPNDPLYSQFSSCRGRFMFEDLFPFKGDYDFNDVVVDYQLDAKLDANGDVRKINLFFLPMNDGAGFDNAIHLQFPNILKSSLSNISDSSSFNIPITSHDSTQYASWKIWNALGTSMTGLFVPAGDTVVHSWMQAWNYDNNQYNLLGWGRVDAAGDYEWIFSLPDHFFYSIQYEYVFEYAGYHHFIHNSFDLEPDEILMSSLSFEITPGYSLDQFTGTNFQLFIEREDGQKIFTKEINSSFQDNSGMPFAMHVPQEVAWPAERGSIQEKYPNFTSWATSNGTENQNWWE